MGHDGGSCSILGHVAARPAPGRCPMRLRERDGAGGQRRPDPKPRRRARGHPLTGSDRGGSERRFGRFPGRARPHGRCTWRPDAPRHPFRDLDRRHRLRRPAQTPPAQQADQPQLRFHPVTRGTDPVGVIYASPAPRGCPRAGGGRRREALSLPWRAPGALLVLGGRTAGRGAPHPRRFRAEDAAVERGRGDHPPPVAAGA